MSDEFTFKRDDAIFDGWDGARFRVTATNPHGTVLAGVEHYRAESVVNPEDTGIFYHDEMKDVKFNGK